MPSVLLFALGNGILETQAMALFIDPGTHIGRLGGKVPLEDSMLQLLGGLVLFSLASGGVHQWFWYPRGLPPHMSAPPHRGLIATLVIMSLTWTLAYAGRGHLLVITALHALVDANVAVICRL